MTSDYRYRLVISRQRGLIPIQEVHKSEEILSFGEWKSSPEPVQGICLECSFDLLPTTIFEKSCVIHKREVSILHAPPLKSTTDYKPELSVRGFFKEKKTERQFVFKGFDDLPYWLPRLIKLYNQPFFPVLSQIGWNIYDVNLIKFEELKGEELTERNLEYILEGMNRRTFSYNMGKYNILPYTQWNETHKIVMRLLDIECDIFASHTVVKNPINFYRHIKDDYIKARIKDEEIVYNLKRSEKLPLYTNGYNILSKKEVTDWVLPGLNPDINGMNPINCFEKGFTSLRSISTTPTVEKVYNGKTYTSVTSNTYLENNLYNSVQKQIL